jgi:hypothetical protein
MIGGGYGPVSSKGVDHTYLPTALVDLGRFYSCLILYTVGGTPWKGDQPVARPLHTHRINTHNTDIYASSGIGTHDPSIRAGEDISCLRSRGHCDCWIFFHSSLKGAGEHKGVDKFEKRSACISLGEMSTEL